MSEEKEPPQTDNWWKPRPGELPVVNVLVVIVGFVSAVAALVALFVRGSMAILVWSAAIAFLTVALLIAFFRIRKRRVQLPLPAVLAGIVVLIGIAAVGLVVIVRARGPIQTAPSGPSASAQLVFSDRFCTAVGGWTVGSSRTGGHYDRCAFRIYANANDIESSEPHARTVYPAAPSGIEITVTARRVLGAAEGDQFGIACRADGEGYAFIVQSDLAEIIKYSSKTGQIGQPLAHVPAAVDMNARNKIQATCATGGDGSAQLDLSVNGKELATATDTDNPIPGGTIGIFAATTSATQTPTEAEFEDFTVVQL
jgi:hypothetical protein